MMCGSSFRTVVLITVILTISVSAFSGDRATTPYGDYCKECGRYGVCKEAIPPEKAVNSLKDYYREKGYSVENINHKGRFIRADIYKKNKQVDKVLFDRKTGRLRSIY